MFDTLKNNTGAPQQARLVLDFFAQDELFFNHFIQNMKMHFIFRIKFQNQ